MIDINACFDLNIQRNETSEPHNMTILADFMYSCSLGISRTSALRAGTGSTRHRPQLEYLGGSRVDDINKIDIAKWFNGRNPCKNRNLMCGSWRTGQSSQVFIGINKYFTSSLDIQDDLYMVYGETWRLGFIVRGDSEDNDTWEFKFLNRFYAKVACDVYLNGSMADMENDYTMLKLMGFFNNSGK